MSANSPMSLVGCGARPDGESHQILMPLASEWELDPSVLGIELTDELLSWAKGRADREFRRRGPPLRPSARVGSPQAK